MTREYKNLICEDMKISLLQTFVDSDANKNLVSVLKGIQEAANQQSDLVVLAELWSTPFDLLEIQAHQHDWQLLVPALQKAAKEYGIWIVGGTLPRLEKEKLYNSCPVINQKGELIEIVDKCHLLEVHTSKHTFKESDVFCPGQRLKTVKTPWGELAILICYDNRFPEAARLLCEKATLLIAPCGFNRAIAPLQFKPLFQTRAIENEVFVVALNPAYAKYKQYESHGHSLLINPAGHILGELSEKPSLYTAEIDLEEVNRIRTRSPFWSLRRLDIYSLQAKDAKKRKEE